MYSKEPTVYLKLWAHDYESMIEQLEENMFPRTIVFY